MEARENLLTYDLDRRDLLKIAGGFGLALAMLRKAGIASAVTGAGTYRTTTALNLRSGPGTGYAVLLVMPAGAIAHDYDGELKNGFRSLDYKGTVGWAADSYLVLVTAPVIIGALQTTAAVNLRNGPGTGYGVLQVVPKGAWVDISATVQNGFRYVSYNGTIGWISDSFLGGPDAEAFTTTVALNLRSGPGTSYSVLLVMPMGATVLDYDFELVNGFRSVDYQGTVGWAYNAYLA